MSFRVLLHPEVGDAAVVAEVRQQSAVRLTALSADGAHPSTGTRGLDAPLETCSLAAHKDSDTAFRPTEPIARHHGTPVGTHCDARQLLTEGGDCVNRLTARLPLAFVLFVASLALFVGGFADGR